MALMYSVGCGDVRAMNYLVDNYIDLVSRTAFRMLCDRKDSEAVTSAVFIHAWNYSSKFDGAISLSFWLLRLTSRYARLRGIRRRLMYFFGERPDLFVTTAPKSVDYDDFVTKQAWELYCRASMKLSIRQRVLFTLCVLEEIPEADVSMITGIPMCCLSGMLSAAESKIKKELRKKGKPEDYSRYVCFLRKVAEGFTEHDKLKRMIMASIQ